MALAQKQFLTVLQTSIKYTRDELLSPERHRPAGQGVLQKKKEPE